LTEKKLKVLVFGVGVLGSLYAARLQQAGNDVTVVARGQRYADIKEHGIVLEYFNTKKQTNTPVRALDSMPADEYFDLCLVPVQKLQLESALEALKVNTLIPAFLFMVNTAEGPQPMIDALGRERVLFGFANAGGERDGHLVRVMEMKGRGVMMGELDGSKSERLQRFASAFKDAGFTVEFSRNVDAWMRYHVALVGPLANALYMAGSCNYRLAHNPHIIRKGLRGLREAIRVLRANGFPVEPPALKVMLVIPDFILVPLARRFINTELLDIGGARHARNARDEMKKLNEELFALARKVGMDTPAMAELHRYADPAVPPAVSD